MKIDPKKWDWITVLIGVAVMSLGIQFGKQEVDFYLHSTMTLGDVVKLNQGGYHPEVAFTASNGERISFPGSSSYPVEVGDRIEVRYLQSDPRGNAKLNQPTKLFGALLIPTVVGGIIVILGIMGKSLLRGRGQEDGQRESK